MRWILLLRAVNLGPHNRLAMPELTRVLSDLGHEQVRTYLSSGNATFHSTTRSASRLAEEIEKALHDELGLDVRACVRRDADLQTALEALPDLPGYVTVTSLFDPPQPQALKAFLATDWSPEVVAGDDRFIYIGYVNAGRSKLTLARIEKALGVAGTARTPATLRKLLA